jgi:hypothetical protein
MYFLGKLEEEFVWAQHSKGKGDSKLPSFGKSCINGLVVVSSLGDDMSCQRQAFISSIFKGKRFYLRGGILP